MPATEMILKMEMEATDAQSGQSGSMVMTMDTWVVPKAPGYEEVTGFHKRMWRKIGFLPGQMPMARPEMSQGMLEIAKEASKLEGMQVYSTTRMGGPGTPAQGAQPESQPAEQPKQQSQQPSAGSVPGGAQGDSAGLLLEMVRFKQIDSRANLR